MAGPFPGGKDGEFREGIQFAMEMGLAPAEANQPVFIFPSRLVYDDQTDGTVDKTGVPFNPDVPVRNERPAPVKDVVCAIEYFDERGQQSPLGDIHATRVKITLLDEEYVKVQGCEAVILGGDKYIYRRTQPPSGLFDVGFFEMWFHAEDET